MSRSSKVLMSLMSNLCALDALRSSNLHSSRNRCRRRTASNTNLWCAPYEEGPSRSESSGPQAESYRPNCVFLADGELPTTRPRPSKHNVGRGNQTPNVRPRWSSKIGGQYGIQDWHPARNQKAVTKAETLGAYSCPALAGSSYPLALSAPISSAARTTLHVRRDGGWGTDGTLLRGPCHRVKRSAIIGSDRCISEQDGNQEGSGQTFRLQPRGRLLPCL